MSDQEEQMKLKDAPYSEDVINRVKMFPILRDNFKSILQDFEDTYTPVLDQVIPLPVEQLSKIKSDLFLAFSHGVRAGIDTTSSFRTNFMLPKEILDKIQNPASKLILPDSKIIT